MLVEFDWIKLCPHGAERVPVQPHLKRIQRKADSRVIQRKCTGRSLLFDGRDSFILLKLAES